MTYYCPTCGKPIQELSWTWSGCDECHPFQHEITNLLGSYKEEMPEEVLQAVKRSLSRYDMRSGMLLVDKQAEQIRAAIAHRQQQDFYGALSRPSMSHTAQYAISASFLDLILTSGLLPKEVTSEIQAFLKEVKERAEQVNRVHTFQYKGEWHATPADRPADQVDEYASGQTEAEALEKLYAKHPELRPRRLTTPFVKQCSRAETTAKREANSPERQKQ